VCIEQIIRIKIKTQKSVVLLYANRTLSELEIKRAIQFIIIKEKEKKNTLLGVVAHMYLSKI
jgi:hypothetical protein